MPTPARQESVGRFLSELPGEATVTPRRLGDRYCEEMRPERPNHCQLREQGSGWSLNHVPGSHRPIPTLESGKHEVQCVCRAAGRAQFLTIPRLSFHTVPPECSWWRRSKSKTC